MKPNNRAQFYILSIVIIVLTIVTFATGILETTPTQFSPQQTSFLLHNLESEAEQAFQIGKQQNTIESTFDSFAQKTESELAKEQISLDWNYQITSNKIDVTITLKSGTTIVQDSFTLS